MPQVDLSQEGTNRDVQQQMLRGGPPMRASLANARLPFGMGDGMRLLGASAQSVSAQFVIEGQDPGAGITSLVLSVAGGMPFGSGEPGIPVSVPATLRWVATSWMSTNAPAGVWTLECWRRRGTGSPTKVATFAINTT